ncbi:hypothetical protein C8R42DRAFT_721678 [Lentinula raphanica]|nr:hypothetical protein C8R42DRAFT_721678 [Lentinula raphanica]
MASSSKAAAAKPSTTKKATGNRVYGVTPLASSSLSLDVEVGPATTVKVYNAVRAIGDTPDDPTALFLPASAEECSVLVNNFRRFPNSAAPAFHLPHYANPEKLEFRGVLASLTSVVAPATFYPPRYIRTCPLFSEGRSSKGEGLHLYQALVILQRAFVKIINGHHSKSEIVRHMLQFAKQPNFSDCLRYYHEHWHYTNACPLFAPLLIAFICDFCEEHLSPADYKKYVYDSKARTGYGMSSKTRQRVKDCLAEALSLKTLAIPIPFDPTTREGQIIITVASRGTEIDQIRQPYTNIALRPDPTKRIVVPKASKTRPVPRSSKVPPTQSRVSSPEHDGSGSDDSSFHGNPTPSSPQAFPVPDSPILVDEDDDEDDVFREELPPPAPVLRRSIARAAKSKTHVPEVTLTSAAPAVKRDRAPSSLDPDTPVAEPPTKKRRTQASLGKTRAPTPKPVTGSPVPPKKPVPFRIQEGEPDYFEDDDIKTDMHKYFVTNPDFQTKVPFSQLISKTIAQNPRAPKLPFLRPPKWKISEELRNFGAFVNSADTTFSLQGLSRYSYMTSRYLQTSLSTTLPSPEAVHSTSNCLTCLARGVVCEGGGKLGGPCSHCDRTHRSCSSCLALEEHKDRFLALHNTIQGFPVGTSFYFSFDSSVTNLRPGYSGSLDRFQSALVGLDHVHSSFETMLNDARQRLARSLQEVRSNGFDYNVVLSQWADDNPNLPLEYDMLVWLATFFGWDSSCNIAKYLVNPADTTRLEDFLRSNVLPSEGSTDPVMPELSHPSVPNPLSPSVGPAPTILTPRPPSPSSELVLRSRRRPAAATPINFTQDRKPHSPPAPLAGDDDEMDVEDGASRTSGGQALVAGYDDSEEDDNADVNSDDEDDDDEPAEIAPPAPAHSPKAHK